MRCLSFSQIILIGISLVASVVSAVEATPSPSLKSETPAPKVHSKVEELFIWKMSDELALTPAEEKKFTELVKSLNQKKMSLNNEMQDHLREMTAAKTDADKSREFGKYKKALQASNHLGEEELDKMKALLGIKRSVQYLVIKQDMTTRLKNLLANPDAAPKSTPVLPPPKIIEETP